MLKETSKTERLLQLILFLDNPRSKQACLDYLNIADSTFYEYVNQLKYTGFIINQEHGNYRIDSEHSENHLLSHLLHFSEEEAWMLSKAINKLDVSVPTANRLVQRLTQLFNSDETLTALIKKEKSEILDKLHAAMKQKKQVLLKQYASGNSQTIKDRWIEPFAFRNELTLLWAFDIQKMECRQFKTARIHDVEPTPLDWRYTREHHCMPIDVFRNTGELNRPIQVEMNLRAYNLLIEEYPLAEKECHQLPDGHYLLETSVAKYEGASRFVLGLADDISVKGPPEFFDFLHLKAKIIENKFLTPENPESVYVNLPIKENKIIVSK
jgi:predicted DNA-binding transcriptional regulator YafY